LNNLDPLSLETLLINLALAGILSIAIAWFYARFGEALSNRYRFARLLPMLTLIVVLVISVIKSSLALSLGLVGSLSIVRFRTPIKDPEELLYLFLAIAIGLGFGADQRIATLVAMGVILVVLVLRRLFTPQARRRNLYLSLQVADGDADGASAFESVNRILASNVALLDLRRLDRHQQTLQLTYLLECKDPSRLAKLMSELKAGVPGCSFSFIDQSNVPGS
jgi:hypothetical protein